MSSEDRWLIAGQHLLGLRTPPRYLPDAIRWKMWADIHDARRRSLCYRFVLMPVGLAGFGIPLAMAQVMVMHFRTPDGDVARTPLLVAAISIWFGVTLAIARANTNRACIRVWRANNVCPRCDYDLRATPDRCPECGALASRGDPI